MGTETAVRVAEESADGQLNVDGILNELGSFGKYQVFLLFLLAFRDSFLAMCNFNYVFTAADVAHRCIVPECELAEVGFNVSWISFALMNDTRSCQRPLPYGLDSNSSIEAYSPSWATQYNETCSPERFHFNRTMSCEKIVYEDYNSIVAEFDLGCQPWKRTMIGSVHNLGLVVSFLLSGFISDRVGYGSEFTGYREITPELSGMLEWYYGRRLPLSIRYGRKVVIIITPLVVGIVGLIKSFSVNYWMLLVFEFLETALGYGNASMVLSLETVSHKRRVIFSCIADILSSFGSSFLGLIAWKIPYWRYLMRAIYAPLLVVVFYIFLVDEGVRWLLAHNRNDEAVRVLNKVAKINNITLSNKSKETLTKISHQNNKPNQDCKENRQKSQLLSVLRSKKILLRVILMAACFFCAIFVHIGTVVNSTNLSGSKYLNFSLMLLVAVPTRAVTAFTLTRFGRKTPICAAYCLCAIFFIASVFVPNSARWLGGVWPHVAASMCASYGLFSLTVLALEVFPTPARNSLTNAAATAGRLAAALAPHAPLLEKYMTGLTSIVFGLVALGPAALSLMFPDTTNTDLPDSVNDAERLGDADVASDLIKCEVDFKPAIVDQR